VRDQDGWLLRYPLECRSFSDERLKPRPPAPLPATGALISAKRLLPHPLGISISRRNRKLGGWSLLHGFSGELGRLVVPQQELSDLERLLAGFPGKGNRGFYREQSRTGAPVRLEKWHAITIAPKRGKDFLFEQIAQCLGNRFCDAVEVKRKLASMQASIRGVGRFSD
jgi:hypothetical protein